MAEELTSSSEERVGGLRRVDLPLPKDKGSWLTSVHSLKPTHVINLAEVFPSLLHFLLSFPLPPLPLQMFLALTTSMPSF